MTVRRGQVAVYLALVLVAICFLMLMNVGVYLAVSSKNKAMNAGDAAALAVAKYQGELLNSIGALNIEHLSAIIEDDEERCREIEMEQVKLSLLRPVDGIAIGNAAAKANGAEPSDRMRKILAQHVIDIRRDYVNNPDLYPEAYEGAWEAYAQKIETAIAGGIWAGPDNIEFIDAAGGHTLLTKCFYNAIAGRNWCWFFFRPGILDSYASFRDWAPLPSSDVDLRKRWCVNSEIYSLHVRVVMGSALTLFGKELVMQLTGASEDEVKKSSQISDPTHKWFFYDDTYWRKWFEIDPASSGFPVVGGVKREYDTRGCAAACRVERDFVNMNSGDGRKAVWTGAAKPFGTVEGENGDVDVVTSLKGGFIVPSFANVRLVPLDAVGGSDLSTADADWMDHVRDHLPAYLRNGPNGLSQCWYCQQLSTWEKASFRQMGKDWLKFHSGECERNASGPYYGRGGTPHGH